MNISMLFAYVYLCVLFPHWQIFVVLCVRVHVRMDLCVRVFLVCRCSALSQLGIYTKNSPSFQTLKVRFCTGLVAFILGARSVTLTRSVWWTRVSISVLVLEFVWSQEEPANMGTWTFVEPRFRKQLGLQVSTGLNRLLLYTTNSPVSDTDAPLLLFSVN